MVRCMAHMPVLHSLRWLLAVSVHLEVASQRRVFCRVATEEYTCM